MSTSTVFNEILGANKKKSAPVPIVLLRMYLVRTKESSKKLLQSVTVK